MSRINKLNDSSKVDYFKIYLKEPEVRPTRTLWRIFLGIFQRFFSNIKCGFFNDFFKDFRQGPNFGFFKKKKSRISREFSKEFYSGLNGDFFKWLLLKTKLDVPTKIFKDFLRISLRIRREFFKENFKDQTLIFQRNFPRIKSGDFSKISCLMSIFEKNSMIFKEFL